MNTYLDQIFNEGLGLSIYVPIKKLIDKKIKEKRKNNYLTNIIKLLYVLFDLSCSLALLYFNFPLR